MDPEPSSYFLFLSYINPFDPALIAPLVILGILLIGSAVISGSEVAFFSLKAQDLDNMKSSHKSTYDTIVDLLDHPKTLLATILISNNFINVGIVILSSFITNQLFDFTENPTLGFVIQVGLITFLILLFGEVLPKVYATRNAPGFSSFMSRPMYLMRMLFRPVSRLLVRSTTLIERRLRTNTENLSVNDLSQALEITTHDENTTQEEQKMLQGIVKFGNTTVKQIMKPRMDVVCVEVSWDYEKVLNIILESGYSRIPVYEDNLDQIRGTLYIKDLLPYEDAAKDFSWIELVRDSFFVPENKKIDDLLKEFQEKKIHLAIVVDEFGGTSGVITLEDVIEEIVGEISDEFDDDDLVYSKLDEKTYIFEGKTHLTDFMKVIDVDDEIFNEASGDADTLAGFLLEIAGKFPETDEIIEFEKINFKVESKDGRRIKSIKVMLPEKEEDEA